MTAQTFEITVGTLSVSVVRKAIKNLHLGVYPPGGTVRVAVPLAVSDDAVRLAVIDKLGWIRSQQAKFTDQPRQSEREMVRGESHYYLGRRYRLRLVARPGATDVSCHGDIMELFARENSTAAQYRRILEQWYRERLREVVPPLLSRWEERLGVRITQWDIKRMKTKWGTCTIGSRRIWLNSELIKKPIECIEYVILHELLHLLERHHNHRFTGLLDTHLPQWRSLKEMLNAAPLAYEDW